MCTGLGTPTQKLGWRFIGPAITQAESDDEIYHIFAHLFFLHFSETSSCVQRANRLYIYETITLIVSTFPDTKVQFFCAFLCELVVY